VAATPQQQEMKLYKSWNYFSVDTNTNAEQISQIRFIGHLYATISSAPVTSILSLFRNFMENPKSYGDNFLPAMEIDMRQIIQGAMKDYKTTFSRFHECPNGHPYYIGDCGMAFTKGKCPECGEPIGGGGHQLLTNNKRMEANDLSPPGYTLPFVPSAGMDPKTRKPKAILKDDYAPKRALTTPAYVCIVRLLLHGSMWCGMVMQMDNLLGIDAGNSADGVAERAPPAPGATKPELYVPACNKDYVNLNEVRKNEMEWVKHQFVVDWKMLKEFLSDDPESISKFLHIMLDTMMKACMDGIASQRNDDGAGAGASGSGSGGKPAAKASPKAAGAAGGGILND
jgi:hypothetical protein